MMRPPLARALVGLLALIVARRTLARPARPAGDRGGHSGPPASTDAPVRYGSLLVVILVALLVAVGAGLTILLSPFGFVRDLDDQLPDQGALTANAVGDPARGRATILAYGCRACHTVPGLPALSDQGVGPPLTDFAGRRYIAGVMPNRPANLVAWLQDPPAFAPGTAMPDMGISRAEAADIARYLYTHSD